MAAPVLAGNRFPLQLLRLSRLRVVHTQKQGLPLLRSREVSTNPHTGKGRLKLIQEGENKTHTLDSNGLVAQYYFNRNPRSRELLGIAEKPRGFATWHRRVDYYHRLMVVVSDRHFTAYVDHNNGTKVVEASTKEFCISRHLYKTSDVSAAFNVGRVVASRCKEAGLRRVMWEHKWNRNHGKVIAFLKGVQLEGLILNEPKQRNKLPEPGSLPGY